MDKLKLLKDLYDSLSGIVKCHLFIPNQGCSSKFIEDLNLKFLALPSAYLEFLKEFDGLNLDWMTFYGSPDAELFSLFDMLKLWEEAHELNLIKLDLCPIGEDAGSDLYCLNEKGQVVMLDSEIYEEQEPKLIAESFEIFMDECVLGKRYPEMNIEDSTFHKFLKSQGWA